MVKYRSGTYDSMPPDSYRYAMRVFICFVPVTLFIFLAGGNFQSWKSARDLSRQLTLNQSASVAEEIVLQLDILVQKNSRSLALLSNLWRESPAANKQETFLKWANAIIKEPNFDLILYIDSGNIMMVTPPALRFSSLSGIDIQSRPAREDFFKTLRKSIAPLEAPSTARVTPQGIMILWFPILEEMPEGSSVSGTIAGSFQLERLVSKVLSPLTRRDFNIKISVNNRELVNISDESHENSYTRIEREPIDNLSGSKEAEIAGLPWKVEVFPRGGGAFLKLAGNDRTRLIVQVLLSALVSALLALSLYAIDKMYRSRKRELLSEQRLRQSMKMESIGTLAGGIAHDFNNILGSILGFTQMAILENREEKNRERLEQVFKAANVGKELVRQILTFSRRSEERRGPVHVAPIIKETLKLMRASLPSGITLHHYIEAEDGVVIADPTQIHQILTNLCTNAAQAISGCNGNGTGNGNGNGSIYVTLTRDWNFHDRERDDQAENGIKGRSGKKESYQDKLKNQQVSNESYLVISVKDSGSGIDEEIMDRIFEPYFTTKDVGKGTGMGLSVIHGIVTEYGGAIDVESSPGTGATFRIFLPESDLKHVSSELPEKRSPEPETTDRETGTILLVDDNASILATGKDMLQYLGYPVTTCEDPSMALDKIIEQPDLFDCVITDLTMPGMNGTELASRIADINPAIPVILSTGNSSRINYEELVNAGIKEILIKPLLLEDIASALKAVLK